jgi:fucose 4-O-acetylase-like acetyltransferase
MGSIPYAKLFKDNPSLGLINRAFAYAVGLLLLVCVLALTPKRKTILSVIGRYTLIIYLSHMLIIKIMYQSVLSNITLSNNKRLDAILTLIIIALAVAVVSTIIILISNYIKKLKKAKLNPQN